MRATLCLPTYNERENLARMIEALAGVLRDGDRVLVIDDNSPDGTGAIADELAATHPFVSVLHRERKEGLGRAYIDGFEHVLAGDAELVLEMDCDFSHDPQDVPRLIAAAESGADVVLGSRYVRGGGVRDWGLVRQLISRGGSVYTALFLRMGVKDPTGGFKCFRRAVLEGLDLDAITPRGYAFSDRDDLPREAPPASGSWRSRSHVLGPRGRSSKMSRAVVLEAIWRVPLLRLRG